jgi:hypothetical protein
LSKEEERTLSQSSQSLFALGPHGVIVDHENGVDEAQSFAEELVTLFKAIPGWIVGGSNYVTQLGPRETGVFLIVSEQEETRQAVSMIMASLKREEIACELRRRKPTSDNYLGPQIFQVFVRSRP